MRKMNCLYIFLALIFSSNIIYYKAVGQEKQSATEKIQSILDQSGIDMVEKWYDGLKVDDKKKYSFDEEELIKQGNTLRSFGNVYEAIQILKITVDLFPNSSTAWQYLGYAHIRFLEKDSAIVCYQKALELNSQNWEAREQLQLIENLLDEAGKETRAMMKFKPGENTGKKGQYFGQKPPGLKPELFAPGIVSVYGSNENTVTFSPDGKEIYFGKEAGIWVSKLIEDGWTAPENTGFPGYEMWISPKTFKMYYSGLYEPGIWVMERLGSEWSKPKRLVENGMFSTLTLDETLYTTVFKQGAFIGKYRKIDGKYSEPEIFGPEINNPKSFNAHPNVAADESFVIFDTDYTEESGLHISFHRTDGSWSKAKYLGKEFSGNCSTLSPDGKYLFFMKNRDIYWVSAKIIEKFRPDDLK